MLDLPTGQGRRWPGAALTLLVIVAVSAFLALLLLLTLAPPAHGAAEPILWSGSMMDLIALVVAGLALVVAVYAAGRPYTRHHQ